MTQPPYSNSSLACLKGTTNNSFDQLPPSRTRSSSFLKIMPHHNNINMSRRFSEVGNRHPSVIEVSSNSSCTSLVEKPTLKLEDFDIQKPIGNIHRHEVQATSLWLISRGCRLWLFCSRSQCLLQAISEESGDKSD